MKPPSTTTGIMGGIPKRSGGVSTVGPWMGCGLMKGQIRPFSIGDHNTGSAAAMERGQLATYETVKTANMPLA